MVETNDTPNTTEDRELEELFQSAGSRDDLPVEDLMEIRASFRQAWRQRVAEDGPAARRFPAHLWLAAAAALVLAVAVAGWLLGRGEVGAGIQVASVETLQDRLIVRRVGSEHDREAAVGEAIRADSSLRTDGASAGAALRLDGGASLRLDRSTELEIRSPSSVRLTRGAVYVDTESGDRAPGAAEAIEITTPYGTVRDIGTQFEVRLVEDAPSDRLRVRVREGVAVLEDAGQRTRIDARQELTLHADGSRTRGAIDPTADGWGWTKRIAPRPLIEGMTVRELARRVAREGGWELRFASPELEREAGEITLHGPGRVQPTEEALRALLPGAGYRHELRDGVLEIAAP